MNYAETLEHLYAKLPMFSRVGSAAYKADLSNTLALCEALGNPQYNLNAIHIAGTNGKGSTSHMLAAILQQAGYKTGLYTSPHVHHFGERIRINGIMIDEAFVIDFTARTQQLCEDIQPSFFELTVAMAFLYFSQQQVDTAIIETGLGGRLDSTNIIMPRLSIITNIGFDHVQILGNTLDKIAYEKAGIIKQAVPVVIGEYLPETKNVFLDKALSMNAEIFFATDNYSVSNVLQQGNKLQCLVTDRLNYHKEEYSLDMAGLYQINNLKTVLAAEKVLLQQGFKISNGAKKHALSHVKELTGIKGRWDIMQEHPKVIYDVAHNEHGITQVIKQLSGHTSTSLHFVLGFVKDKDIEKVLALFPKDANYYFTNAHIERALPAGDLFIHASNHGLHGKVFRDVNLALKAAKDTAAADDVIMVCGSFFVIAEIEP